MKKFYQILVVMAALMFPTAFATAEEAAKNGVDVKASAAPAQTAPTVKAKKAKTVKKAKAVKETKAPEKTVYICPMCHIKADKPGKCPECGMDMVKMTKEKDAKADKDKKM